jgi:hypothetical protein
MALFFSGIAQELSEAARIMKDRLTREHPADAKDDVVLVSKSVQEVRNLAGASVDWKLADLRRHTLSESK